MKNQSKVEKIVIGKSVFKETVNLKLIQTENITNALKQHKYLSIGYKNYQKENWKEIFSYMTECSNIMIWMGNNDHPQIIKQIQNVQFTNLEQLILYNNQIKNIEPLIYINCLHLQFLQLSHNNINQIKCLKKWSPSSLKQLYLQQNFIVDSISLTKSKFSDKQAKFTLMLQQNNQSSNSQDINFLVKLNLNSIKQLIIGQDKRVKQIKLLKLMKMRFLQFI